MSNISGNRHPRLVTALLLSTALTGASTAWAQETVPLLGPDVPIECIDPVTGSLILTEENLSLCEPFVSGLTVPAQAAGMSFSASAKKRSRRSNILSLTGSCAYS